MSREDLEGIRINGKVISAAVGLMTLFLALVGGVSFVIKQDYRLGSLEADLSQVKVEIKEADQRATQTYEKILEKVDKLTAEVNKLTLSLGKIEYKQDLTPLTKN